MSTIIRTFAIISLPLAVLAPSVSLAVASVSTDAPALSVTMTNVLSAGLDPDVAVVVDDQGMPWSETVVVTN